MALGTLDIVADALNTTIYGAREPNLNQIARRVNQAQRERRTACEHTSSALSTSVDGGS
jgi:hypothetical protein